MTDAELNALMHQKSTEDMAETTSPQAIAALPEVNPLGPEEIAAIRELAAGIRAMLATGKGVAVTARVSPALYQALMDKFRALSAEFDGLGTLDLQLPPNSGLTYRGCKIMPDLRMKRLNFDVLARLPRLPG